MTHPHTGPEDDNRGVTTWWPRRAGRVLLPLLLAGLAGLAGCTPGAPAPSTTPPAGPAPPAVPPLPAPDPTVLPTAAMPSGDGGPMLWPTTSIRQVYLDGWTTEQISYGFVDDRAQLVVPPRYGWYEYCRDEAGRASLVLAGSAAEQVDILDLSGQVIGTVPGRYAGCIGDTHAEFQREISETGPVDVGSGLFDLRSGEVIIKPRKGRAVMLLDRRTVNVHQAKGEYFLDVLTGERTPHPGFVSAYPDPQAEPADLALIPASEAYTDPQAEPETPPRMGYLDRRGGWALKPTLARTEPFHAGYAVVGQHELDHFVDTDFRRVGDDWAWISQQEWGYQVGQGSGEQARIGLLGLDLRVILEPTDAEIDCNWSSNDACGIHPRSGPPKVLLLPEGRLADPPEGFGTVLNRTLFSDATRETPATRIHNTATGLTFSLPRPSDCGVAGSWIACTPVEPAAPPTVHTGDGRQTVFRDVLPIEGAVAGTGSGYYWAVAGSDQGFIDEAGNWLYRESRYQNLED